MTSTVFSSVSSAQWLPFGIALGSSTGRGAMGSDLSMTLRVLARAIIFGWAASAGTSGDEGAYGTKNTH